MSDLREKYKGKTVADCAKAMLKLADKIDALKKDKLAPLQMEYDFLKFSMVPDLMDEQGVTSMKVAGVGNVIKKSDITVTQEKDKSGDLYQWIGKHDPDALVLWKPTLNSSSFAAYIRERMKEGRELPTACIKVGANTYVTITKG